MLILSIVIIIIIIIIILIIIAISIVIIVIIDITMIVGIIMKLKHAAMALPITVKQIGVKSYATNATGKLSTSVWPTATSGTRVGNGILRKIIANGVRQRAVAVAEHTTNPPSTSNETVGWDTGTTTARGKKTPTRWPKSALTSTG